MKTYWMGVVLFVLVVPCCGWAADKALSTDELLSIVKGQYFRPDVPDLEEKLREGAARGFLDSLNEIQRGLLVGPVASRPPVRPPEPEMFVNKLFTPAEYRLLKEEIAGQFCGVGMRLKSDHEKAPFDLIEAIAGLPAAKAGLKANDRIVAVDSVAVDGWNLQQIVLKLRGPEGSTVRLKVKRDGREFDVELKREKVKIPSVELTARPGGMARLKLGAFNESTAAEVRAALEKASADKVWGLVVDLRGNPGGLFEVSVEVSRMFLEPGKVIVKTQRRGQPEQVYKSEKAPIFAGPVVLLVGRDTGSSAEIFSGALKENGRALVVGTRTMGKGTGETVVSLASGHALKITTMVFFGPSGRSPTAGGIDPDVPVAVEPGEPKDPTADAALDAAFRILGFARR